MGAACQGPAEDRRAPPKGEVRIVLDAMLGNVARDLRLLGFDALYLRDAEDAELLRIAQSEQRVLVTRDRPLCARARNVRCVLVTESEPKAQAVEVLRALSLTPRPEEAYSRCLACNDRLEAATPADALASVPDHVATSARGFLRCPACGRTYWRGSHTARLDARIEEILGSLLPARRQV